MKEHFAVIKLISGEEIFSQVEEFYDEDTRSILLIEPCTMKEIALEEVDNLSSKLIHGSNFQMIQSIVWK